MTQDDIIRMAREAGIIWWSSDQAPLLTRFAALVAAAEREAFAKEWITNHGFDKFGVVAAIRARSKT